MTAPTADSLIAASPLPRAEARRLLEHATGQRREWLLAHGDELLSSSVSEHFLSLQSLRMHGEPLSYLCGEREFHGLTLRVNRAVLIPRPETELLVDAACELAPRYAKVLDLGTGSGAIAVAIAMTRPDLQVVATDCSSDALAVATDNAARHGLAASRLRVRAGSWWQALAHAERFEVIVANPPYIADADPHLAEGDLRFEPRSALASGADGLDALREIASGALAHLAAGGQLIVEHGWNQGAAVRTLFLRVGLLDVHTQPDLAGHERLTFGGAP